MPLQSPFFKAPKPWKNGLTLYPPQNAPSWNTTVLTVEDLQSELFQEIAALSAVVREGKCDFTRFNGICVTFSLLGENGVYDLVPNGRDIFVTADNAEEFLTRFDYEVQRLSASAANDTRDNRESSYSGAPHQRNGKASVRGEVIRIGKSPWSCVYAKANGGDCDSGTSALLTAQDLHFLEEFGHNVQVIKAHYAGFTSDQLQDLRLRWMIVLTKRNLMIPLREDHPEATVEPGEFGQYAKAVEVKLEEVMASIIDTGTYPPLPPLQKDHHTSPPRTAQSAPGVSSGWAAAGQQQQQQVLMNGMGNGGYGGVTRSKGDTRDSPYAITTYEQLYQPVEMTRQEQALFSPTHATGNLFAPLQHVTI